MNIPLELADGSSCDCQAVVSPRAKYLRLKISPAGDVSLVVPRGVSKHQAVAFAESQQAWLTKTLLSIRANPPQPVTLPESLNLQLLDEQWRLEYQSDHTSNAVRWDQDETARVLCLSGVIEELELTLDVIGLWLKYKASLVFPAMLDELSAHMQLPYARLGIRGQKTRWGSCSSRNNISLNYKLLFFPEPVVRYVMIHELCHTLEMNHSPRFWALVEGFEPEYRIYRAILKRQAHEYLPRGL